MMAVGRAVHQDCCKFFVGSGKTEMQAATSQLAGGLSWSEGVAS